MHWQGLEAWDRFLRADNSCLNISWTPRCPAEKEEDEDDDEEEEEDDDDDGEQRKEEKEKTSSVAATAFSTSSSPQGSGSASTVGAETQELLKEATTQQGYYGPSHLQANGWASRVQTVAMHYHSPATDASRAT